MHTLRRSSSLASRHLLLSPMSEQICERLSGIYLGRSRIYRLPLMLDTAALHNPHIAVIGMTGSGKSYMLKSIIAAMHLSESRSVLLIDWNGEYSALIGLLGGTVLNIGTEVRMDPFELLACGACDTGAAAQMISSMLDLQADELVALEELLDRDGLSEHRLHDVKHLVDALAAESGNRTPALAARLSTLAHSAALRGAKPLEMRSLLHGVHSLNLGTAGSDEARRIACMAALELVISQMHNARIGKETDMLVAVDEVWRLGRGASCLGKLFREARKYGIGVAVSTQLGGDLPREVIANAATIAIFKLQSDADLDFLEGLNIIVRADRKTLANMPVGSCMLHMSHGSASRATKVLVGKICGPPAGGHVIAGGTMRVRVNAERFARQTEHLSQDPAVRAAVLAYAEESGGNIDLQGLIALLLRLGMRRRDVVPYLRLLGVDDLQIILAFEAACRCETSIVR